MFNICLFHISSILYMLIINIIYCNNKYYIYCLITLINIKFLILEINYDKSVSIFIFSIQLSMWYLQKCNDS